MRKALERLGGIAAVAEALDLGQPAVRAWISVGRFPIHRRHELEALARERLILLPEHLFVVGEKRGRKRKDAEAKEARA